MTARQTHKTRPSAFDRLDSTRKLSVVDKRAIKKATEAEIDAFLVGAGIKDPLKLADKRGGRYLPFEDTPAYVCVEELEGDLYLRVESKVMELPDDRDQVFVLMNAMLEINASVPGVCRLAVDDGLVVAAGSETLKALRAPDALTQHIELVIEFAEEAAAELKRIMRRSAGARRRRS
ncbi:MAG: hypothetical protein NTV05_09695 [Acidobacteria bacterium]|nr:hypothetical protein [Acidobacteriota bacterium]